MHPERKVRMLIASDELVRQAQKGDETAFNQLTKLWYKRIFNYVLKYSGEQDLTHDITQQTFIAVYRNLPKLKEIESFKPWIYRIATNFCNEEGRKKARKGTLFMDPQTEKDLIDPGMEKAATHRDFNPEPSFQQAELEAILKNCLMQIPEEQRSVIIMKEYEGFKFHEIAEALQTSENTIKTRMYRGLKMMKKQLDEQNITKETIHYEL